MTFVLGLLVSNLFRLFAKDQAELDSNLFFPVIARRIQSRRHEVESNDNAERKYSFTNMICDEDRVDKLDTKL